MSEPTPTPTLPAQTPQSPSPSSPAPKKSRLHLCLLLFLTALSAFLSFNRLSTPPLLIDEVFTYWRTCGTLDQLLDTLRNDAFMPLHYELINWIHQGLPLGFGFRLVPDGIWLTPAALRFIPALCGTLQTAVMYFLARQMFNRRTALYAAAFVTCSAYSLFFSRNAKMYAPAWMLETLAIACFLWWIRTWRRLPWLCWIAAGIAAAGFHSITLLVLMPLPLFYFISMGKFRGRRVPLFLIGLVLIATGPAVYYGVFNRWTQNSGGVLPGVVGEPAPDAQWQNSGLNWIPPAENGVRLPFNALNNYLTGYDWTDLTELGDPPPLLKKYGGAMIALAVVTYGLLILGALPWPHLRRADRTGTEPSWRRLLWLLLWIVIPVYCFFYCRSVDDFSSPLTWLAALVRYASPFWPVSIAAMIALALLLNRWPRLAKFLAIPLLLIAVAGVVVAACNHLDWFNYLGVPGNRAAMVALVPAMLFHYSGVSFRQRGNELLRLLAVVGVVLLLCTAAAFGWRWLHDVSMRKDPELPWQSLWVVRYVALVLPAVWLAAAALISRLPTRAVQIAAVVIICSYNLANGLAREYIQTEPPLDRVLTDVYMSRPNTNVRTYFDLRTIFDNIYYRPAAAYSACLASGLEPSPAQFRTGNAWPYEWGSIIARFKSSCIYNPGISAEQIRADMAAHPQVSRVIVWEIARPVIAGWAFGDPAARGLGDGWTLASDEKITAHWYWTWADQWIFHRREFERKSPIH